MSYRVFVDACLLYPPSPRALILGAALAGNAEFTTSEQVLDEVYRHLEARIGDLAAVRVEEIVTAFESVREGSVVDLVLHERLTPLGLPDGDDEHVVAAALVADADGVLTRNAKDFPEPQLSRVGLELVDVDQFFFEGLGSGSPAWRAAVSCALGFPPANVKSASDLGMALAKFGLECTAGALLAANW